jgi:amino acid transporter
MCERGCGQAYLNYRGLMIVGKAAIVMTVFLLVPFLILIGLSVPHIQPVNWLQVDLANVQWGPFINVMFWCVLIKCAVPLRCFRGLTCPLGPSNLKQQGGGSCSKCMQGGFNLGPDFSAWTSMLVPAMAVTWYVSLLKV